jgi:oxygen-dependent protoporphyrinogen oxidase
VGHPLNGFGALISRARGIRTLGTLFSSTLFPGRASEGKVLLTAFVGGVLDPQAVSLDDEALVGQVLRDLGPLLHFKASPIFRNTARWPRAIPQYESRHGEVVAACEAAESALPGLHLIGNFRGGISMNDCLGNAVALASSL